MTTELRVFTYRVVILIYTIIALIVNIAKNNIDINILVLGALFIIQTFVVIENFLDLGKTNDNRTKK